jgi:hypothetical protein
VGVVAVTGVVEFLAARLEEDEAAAEAAQAKAQVRISSGADFGPALGRLLFHQRFSPERVLAEVAAKRRILAQYVAARAAAESETDTDTEAGWVADGVLGALELAVRALAMPDADHPDFKPEWRLP